MIAYGGKNARNLNNTVKGRASLTENGWFYVSRDLKNVETPADNANVSRDDFLSILSDIKHVLIKAKYHTNQVESKYVRWLVHQCETQKRPRHYSVSSSIIVVFHFVKMKKKKTKNTFTS